MKTTAVNAAMGDCAVEIREARDAPIMSMDMKPAERPTAKCTTPNASTQGSTAVGTLTSSAYATARTTARLSRKPATRETPVAFTRCTPCMPTRLSTAVVASPMADSSERNTVSMCGPRRPPAGATGILGVVLPCQLSKLAPGGDGHHTTHRDKRTDSQAHCNLFQACDEQM